jgi:MFS family permease
LQLYVTNWTKRRPTLQMMALGSLFYAVGVGSVALAHGFMGFWISMVVITIGELILIPTSTTHVANLAPPDMRGRYMSIYGLSWPVASGIAPLLGGILSDNIAPAATWYGGLVIGTISTLIFLAQYWRSTAVQDLTPGD